MNLDIIAIIVFLISLVTGLIIFNQFFREKAKLLASEEFLSLYKRVFDSFGQRAGIPTVEKLRYTRAFPQSAFFIKRNLNMELNNEQQSMLHSYSLQVRKSHIYLGLAIWLGVLTLVSLIWLVIESTSGLGT
ncbi:MAG: hypothetical protein JXQ87_06785 [Bacteroidia bacterium]